MSFRVIGTKEVYITQEKWDERLFLARIKLPWEILATHGLSFFLAALWKLCLGEIHGVGQLAQLPGVNVIVQLIYQTMSWCRRILYNKVIEP